MSEFDQITDTINNVISTQLPSANSWTNTPGSFTKISTSQSGYVWGFSTSSLYNCQIPCSGNWKQIQIKTSTILDLTTDETYVYVLDNSGAIHIGTSDGDFRTIQSPITASSIFSTHSYIWIQNGKGEKRRLAKPCISSTWVDIPADTILITSSNDSTLFGKDSLGKTYQSDETLKTGWSEIPIKQATILSGDSDGIYGIDTNQHLIFCSGNNCDPVNTDGYIPTSISKLNNNVWMTTDNAGDKGNLFWKLDKPDYSTIMNTLTPLDKKRAEIMKDIQTQQEQQGILSKIQKKIDQIKDFMSNVFKNLGTTKEKSEQSIHELKADIQNTQGEQDMFSKTIPLLGKLLVTLICVGLVYLVLGFTGTLAHCVALGVLGIGFYLSIQ